MFCAYKATATTLVDISYSIKQNGIMVNLDYTKPINDDDIIGWKSDRGWVYLTLLGVRAPKNKQPQQNFKGAVRKIVIDDFDESTQLAILIGRPVLGYDIINSKTSPGTVIFIHTEMRTSEVADLKDHINKSGKSVFNVAQSSGFPKFNTNFKNAFDQARKQLGPNSIFEYHGKLYTTNHPGEKEILDNPALVEKQVKLVDKEKVEEVVIGIPEQIVTIEDSATNEFYVNATTGDVIIEKIEISETTTKNQSLNLEKGMSDLVKESNKKSNSWFKRIWKRKKPLQREQLVNNEPEKIETLLVDSFKKKSEEHMGSENLSELAKHKESNLIERDTLFGKELLGEITVDNKSKKKIIKNDDNGFINLDKSLKKYSDLAYLQKKYIPSIDKKRVEKIAKKDIYIPETQSRREAAIITLPDTLTSIASLMKRELDNTNQELQKEYVPSNKQNIFQDSIDVFSYPESIPQDPEYTNPSVLADRSKVKFKSGRDDARKYNQDEMEFQTEIIDQNSWLNYFSNYQDSTDSHLSWGFANESDSSDTFQGKREVLDYSSNENNKYLWREKLPENRPETFPERQVDPGFMYYYNGGIRVEANMAGIPIYIDGKYVGETPLVRPVQVEPGWHQVSGFSPVYTHLANQQGLQYVGSDPIIENNELYGATTVYAEPGKMETVTLRFNQMGDTPKKWVETKGGMTVGAPFLILLIGFISWGIG